MRRYNTMRRILLVLACGTVLASAAFADDDAVIQSLQSRVSKLEQQVVQLLDALQRAQQMDAQSSISPSPQPEQQVLRYQLHTDGQGVVWRLDTTTGKSCVVQY